MRRSTVTIQFIQDGIIVFNNKKLLKYRLSSVLNYKLINKQLFLNEVSSIIDENNINNRILTDNINIIIDSTYSDIEIDNLKLIFKELSFNKINIINLVNIFTIEEHELLMDISNNIVKIYYNNQVININVYFNKYKQILSIYLKEIVKQENIKSIKIFGNYDELDSLVKFIAKSIINEIYIYSYPDMMPIKLLS